MEPPYAHKRLDVYEPSISTPSPLERKRRPLSIGARVRPQFLVEFWSENRRKIGMERSNIPYGSKHCLRRYLTLQIIPQTLPKKVLGSIGMYSQLCCLKPPFSEVQPGFSPWTSTIGQGGISPGPAVPAAAPAPVAGLFAWEKMVKMAGKPIGKWW